MGNSSSSNTHNAEDNYNSLYDIIDYIATHYILTMDFKSLSKLSEKAYCDNLVVLTSDIIDRYFTDTEVTYLSQRIKNGVEVNELKKDNVRFMTKEQFATLDISNDTQKTIRKKRVCIGIAKFYVKIAHIFSAIIMTINPVYTYKDSNGQTVKTSLLEKDNIPKNVNRKLYKLNICDNRIRALKKGDNNIDSSGNVYMQPRVCDMNVNKNNEQKTLADEPGIQELMRLYLDDNYDYSTGAFTGMSESTKKQFNNDLKNFYTAFTGNNVMPDNITKFSDIKLREYNKGAGCLPPNSTMKQVYKINQKSELFIAYAENIKHMIQSASDNQHKLLSVINDLFRYTSDPYSGKRVVRINPLLTDKLLQKAIENTRKFIIELYIKCEKDYVTGVKLFEAIVESKIIETTQNQIKNLQNEADKIINSTKSEDSIASTNLVNLNEHINDAAPILNEESKQPSNASNNVPVIDPSNTVYDIDSSNNAYVVDSSNNAPVVDSSNNAPVVDSSNNIPIINSSNNIPAIDSPKNIPVIDASNNMVTP